MATTYFPAKHNLAGNQRCNQVMLEEECARVVGKKKAN
jgi:hypothetical protein